MADVASVKGALVQTQALERVQEAARRQGELQQQTFAVNLNRQVDKQEQTVGQGERAEQEKLEPDAKQEREEQRRAHRDAEEKEGPPPADGDEDERGRIIDVRA